jgi:hypothetical protein
MTEKNGLELVNKSASETDFFGEWLLFKEDCLQCHSIDLFMTLFFKHLINM